MPQVLYAQLRIDFVSFLLPHFPLSTNAESNHNAPPRNELLPESRVRLSERPKNLCPKPLRRIDASFIFGIVDLPLGTEFIDLGGFAYSCMVLPEDEHGMRILFKPSGVSARGVPA